MTPDPTQFVFHVTPTCNLPSIAEQGLLPQIGPRSAEANEPSPRVYCFTSLKAVETALSTWLGEQFEADEESLSLLAVAYVPDAPEFFECEIDRPLDPSSLWLITNDLGSICSLDDLPSQWSQLNAAYASVSCSLA